MKKMKKSLTVDIPAELHYNFKLLSVKDNKSMKDILLEMIIDYCNRKKDKDNEWNDFMKAYSNRTEEEPEEGDLAAIGRSRLEYIKGEYQDYDEAIKELENESHNNEIS